MQIYKVENVYHSWGPGIDSTQLDNVSDALMLNIAAFDGSGSVVEKAMMNYRVDHEDSDRQTDDLINWIENGKEEGKKITSYARYWHGYLVWIKPLLVFTTMSNIRILSMCFQFTLMVTVLLGLYKDFGYKGVIPMILTLLCLDPISTALCITYMNDTRLDTIKICFEIDDKKLVTRKKIEIGDENENNSICPDKIE